MTSNNLAHFIPDVHRITNITNSSPAVVTTFDENGYLPGLIVRIVIPYPGSMSQINELIFPITILTDQTFSVPIDSTNFFPFTTSTTQWSQVVPVAENAMNLDSAVNNVGPLNP